MYNVIVFFHILSAFAFVMSHGVSANIAFKLRHETSRERIAALLDLSVAYFNVTYLALAVMLLAGITMGFLGEWWGQVWIWLALGLLFLKSFGMWFLASRPFNDLRKVVNRPLPEGQLQSPDPLADAEEISALTAAIKPFLILIVGFGGLALILWLMLFK